MTIVIYLDFINDFSHNIIIVIHILIKHSIDKIHFKRIGISILLKLQLTKRQHFGSFA